MSNLAFVDISGSVADFLRLVDINAGGFRLKKGQGILRPTLAKTETQTWSQFLGRENSDHGLSLGRSWGRGR